MCRVAVVLRRSQSGQDVQRVPVQQDHSSAGLRVDRTPYGRGQAIQYGSTSVLRSQAGAGQAIPDGLLHANPCAHVTLLTRADGGRLHDIVGRRGGGPGAVPHGGSNFPLFDAMQWPYDVAVHVTAWTGLRAAELAGLQIGELELPPENRPTLPARSTDVVRCLRSTALSQRVSGSRVVARGRCSRRSAQRICPPLRGRQHQCDGRTGSRRPDCCRVQRPADTGRLDRFYQPLNLYPLLTLLGYLSA